MLIAGQVVFWMKTPNAKLKVRDTKNPQLAGECEVVLD
jgi:hypothetical protein